MGTLRRISTGEVLAKTPSAMPRESKRRTAERMGPEKTRALPEAGADDNSAWGQKKRDTEAQIKRLNREAASPANYLGPSHLQNLGYQKEKELQKASGDYSLGTSLKGIAAKGMEKIATAGGDALALGEDILLAPVEVLSGMRLGDLSDTAPMNTWAKNIRREAEGVNRKYQANMEKGGTAARILEEGGSSVIAAVPQAVAALMTGGGTAAAQTTAGLTRTGAAQASSGVGRLCPGRRAPW